MKHTTLSRNLCTALLCAGLLAGCVTHPRIPASDQGAAAIPAVRNGRLSLRIQHESTPQSMMASFELTGNAQNGSLRLFGPLGATLASAQWTSASAVLRHAHNTRTFHSLDELLLALTGAPLPAAALFDWLDGRATEAAGWKADLSQYQQGRIRALRHQPQPAATLQLVLQ